MIQITGILLGSSVCYSAHSLSQSLLYGQITILARIMNKSQSESIAIIRTNHYISQNHEQITLVVSSIYGKWARGGVPLKHTRVRRGSMAVSLDWRQHVLAAFARCACSTAATMHNMCAWNDFEINEKWQKDLFMNCIEIVTLNMKSRFYRRSVFSCC